MSFRVGLTRDAVGVLDRLSSGGSAFLRELIIPFGGSGYLALFEIENADDVSVLAVRHQLEDDYH